MSPSKKVRTKARTLAATIVDVPMIPEGILPDKQLVKRLEQFRDLILNRHEQCIGAGIKLVEKFVCCGEPLAHARAHIGRGSFEKWIADTFGHDTGLGLRTAQRYMRAYRGFIEFLEERNAAPPSGSLAIVTTNKELLLAYCKHVIALREAEKKAKRKSSPRPLSEDIHEAVRSFFSGSQFDEVHLNEMVRADIPHVFVDARTLDGDLQSYLDLLLLDLKSRAITEALLLISFKTALQYETLWQFPIAVIRIRSASDQTKRPNKSKLPTDLLIIYVSLQPDVERFAAALRDIAIVFVPHSHSKAASLALTLQSE